MLVVAAYATYVGLQDPGRFLLSWADIHAADAVSCSPVSQL